MHASGLHVHEVTPSAATVSVVAALSVNECGTDSPGVAIPRAEAQLVVRFGVSARREVDLHVMGVRRRAHRKMLRGGQRVVLVRLHLGAHEALFGVPASEIAERIVPLAQLWGEDVTGRLHERLAGAQDVREAVALVEAAIAERLATAKVPDARSRLALDAATRLATHNVGTVADGLGVSERTLRRAFRETVGMSPKAFAKLTRFQRALREARRAASVDWARVAVANGYYDQAHLIAEFREIAGVTPRALLIELHGPMPRGESPRWRERARAPVSRLATRARDAR